MRKLGWLTLLVAALAPGIVLAQKNQAVKDIDAYCKNIDAAVKKRKEPDRVFADTASETSKHERWKSFASTKALEKFRKRQEVYTTAYNWLSSGKIVGSNFTLSSPSGDWAKYVYHWFRADGTLAREESEYRTFMGDFIVIRRRYFDTKGRHLKSSVRFLDLTTGKPKDAGEGVMGDDPKEVDYYKKTSELPFAGLLKKKY
jgi:hypothetical protein